MIKIVLQGSFPSYITDFMVNYLVIDKELGKVHFYGNLISLEVQEKYQYFTVISIITSDETIDPINGELLWTNYVCDNYKIYAENFLIGYEEPQFFVLGLDSCLRMSSERLALFTQEQNIYQELKLQYAVQNLLGKVKTETQYVKIPYRVII
jgi:hypothetical protein